MRKYQIGVKKKKKQKHAPSSVQQALPLKEGTNLNFVHLEQIQHEHCENLLSHNCYNRKEEKKHDESMSSENIWDNCVVTQAMCV